MERREGGSSPHKTYPQVASSSWIHSTYFFVNREISDIHFTQPLLSPLSLPAVSPDRGGRGLAFLRRLRRLLAHSAPPLMPRARIPPPPMRRPSSASVRLLFRASFFHCCDLLDILAEKGHMVILLIYHFKDNFRVKKLMLNSKRKSISSFS